MERVDPLRMMRAGNAPHSGDVGGDDGVSPPVTFSRAASLPSAGPTASCVGRAAAAETQSFTRGSSPVNSATPGTRWPAVLLESVVPVTCGYCAIAASSISVIAQPTVNLTLRHTGSSGHMFHEVVGGAGPVHTDQDLAPIARWYLGDRLAQHANMVS